ncbi:MAG: PLP-dependent aminotransferase family protein, partial [Planctomycetes bacterium]|nr:PLP-dependent aminotransferase family protein [Planctomycetota bacterium]
SAVPLARQIHRHICDLITGSRLRAGDALPSTRGLAAALQVSRNTVNEAYAILWAEGFIVGRQGSGYTVEKNLVLPGRTASAAPTPDVPARPIRYDFRTGIPDLDQFPYRAWTRCQRHLLETVRPSDMHYGDTGGYPPLRAAIADWLLRSRGMAVEPDAVHITAGATHALSLAVDATGRGGGHFIVENPCHVGIVSMLRLKRVSFSWLPVDESGFRPDRLDRRRVLTGVYVTPSHQFPLGHVLSARRRTSLIAMARERDFYIIEDDYDSEFRYDGPALTPLHSLDPDRVIYVGTFSKILYPALRIGFAIVPPALRPAWREFRRYTDVQNTISDQVVLARFLEERGLDRHVKTMTKAYGQKRAALVAAVTARFGDTVNVLGDSAGLHLAVTMPGRIFDRVFADACRNGGLAVMPCSRYVLAGTDYADTLLLGYGNVRTDRIEDGVAFLEKAIAGHRTD